MGDIIRSPFFLPTIGLSVLVLALGWALLRSRQAQGKLRSRARASEDACWPQPVWGNLAETAEYERQTLENWTAVLESEYGLDCSGG